MPEDFWVGFRPLPKKVEGDLSVVDLTVKTPLAISEVFARATTPSGFSLWAKEVRKVDPRPGGRLELVLWDELIAEGAFAQINMGKSVAFTLDVLGLVELGFSTEVSGCAVTLKSTKIVPQVEIAEFENLAKRFLTELTQSKTPQTH